MKPEYKILLKRDFYEVLNVTCSSHSFPVHIHKKICAGRVDSGEKHLLINGETLTLRPGDLFYIPPLVPHACSVGKGSSVGYTVLCISAVENLSVEMISEDLKSAPELAERIITLCCYALENIRSGAVYDKLISSLIEYINARCCNELSTELLAEFAGLSPFHLLHIFKERTGISLRRYIIQTRIRKSVEAYMTGENILDTALSCGFYDQSHYIKHFKRHVGTTPRDYFASIGFIDK